MAAALAQVLDELDVPLHVPPGGMVVLSEGFSVPPDAPLDLLRDGDHVLLAPWEQHHVRVLGMGMRVLTGPQRCMQQRRAAADSACARG